MTELLGLEEELTVEDLDKEKSKTWTKYYHNAIFIVLHN